jgi:hypothetical protein
MKGERAFERALNTWKYNIKIHLKEIGYEGVDHNQLTCDMNHRGPTKGGEFLDKSDKLYIKDSDPWNRKKLYFKEIKL